MLAESEIWYVWKSVSSFYQCFTGAAYVMCWFAQQCVECGMLTGELGQLDFLIIFKQLSEHTVQTYFAWIRKKCILYICTSVTPLYCT